MREELGSAPDRMLALERYRALAAGYDASARFLGRLRRAAVRALALRPGQTVIDVACGTGVMLPLLAERVGERGRVIGVEQSPEMIALARERVRREGLGSVVTLIESPVEEARLEAQADALLFFYTHDVLQSPAALERLFASANPGARVVAVGARFLPWWWAAPLNAWTALRVRRYLTTYHGLAQPWSHLLGYCPDFRPAASYFLGTSYLGRGTLERQENAKRHSS